MKEVLSLLPFHNQIYFLMRKFKCLVFIDDDYPTNYYHREISEEADIAEELLFFQRPLEALGYLKEQKAAGKSFPEIIFLDINMGGINGWEFAEKYGEELSPSSSRIIMLSTTFNPLDKARAADNQWIDSFKSKPLTIDLLEELREEMLTP